MKKYLLMFALMLGCLIAFPTDAKAIWVVGHMNSATNRCDILGGYCKWVKFPYSMKKLEALDAGLIAFFREEPNVEVAAEIDVKIIKEKMYVNILKLKGTDKFFFDMDKNTALDAESAKMLGYKSVVVKKGKYSTCYGLDNPNGQAVLDVIAK